MAVTETETKVAFLSRPETYACQIVEVKQTHMSWLFLTDTEVWKLKKPARNEYLDFSTPQARKHNCEEEVRLNRRLASDVYRGVVPLGVADGRLRLGEGRPVDWLVCMRRLPANRMLDRAILDRSVSGEDIRKLGALLCEFYRQATAINLTGPDYRNRLGEDTRANRRELMRSEYGLSPGLVDAVIGDQLRVLDSLPEVLEDRARDGKIVEAHGDLRAEHVCLEPRPVIIDCLEFNRDLRILDPASELTFLAMDCERAGGAWAGKALLEAYMTSTGDRLNPQLLAFYRNYHAAVRAKIAVWHLRDEPAADPLPWTQKATQYLRLARLGRAAA